MNQIETNLKKALADAAKKALDTEVEIEKIVIEIPKDKSPVSYTHLDVYKRQIKPNM